MPELTTGPIPLSVLGGLSAETFLREYWQKKPLLIRQALPEYRSPVSPEELAGLALEDEIESRLIIEAQDWALRHGPFKARDFKQLPASHWTLLVQQLDAWCPEINALKDLFKFIPNWRIDDIMASYAPVGGSVGPHFDDYDVFLLQAQGQRQWRIGPACDAQTPLLEHPNLRLLAEFEATQEWTLSAGDMLYLPPKLAHYGVALNDCITLSIGFRAPSKSQLLNMYADHVMDRTELSTRYADPDLQVQDNPAEIRPHVFERIQHLLLDSLQDRKALQTCFGSWITEPKNPATLSPPEFEYDEDWLQQALDDAVTLYRNEGSRFAYAAADEGCQLFVDGRHYFLSMTDSEFVRNLCTMDGMLITECLEGAPGPDAARVVLELLNHGSLYCAEDKL